MNPVPPVGPDTASTAFDSTSFIPNGVPGSPMEVSGIAGVIFTVLTGPFLLVLPVAMCAIGLPKRRLFWLRAIVSVALLLGGLMWAGSVVVAYSVPGQTANWRFMLAQLLEFTIFVIAAALCVMFCFDCSLTSALFCSTVGYTMQKLASSLAGLTISIVSHTLPNASLSLDMRVVTNIWVVVVYLLGYFIIVRRVRHLNLEPTSNLSMLIMVMAVVFFNTLFEIAQRDLSSFGVPFLHTSIISLAQIGTCSLTIFLEYELLYNRQLELDAAAMEQVIANQAHQYQLSRETMDAINLKVHDIKHQIRHLQDGDVQVDAKALASLAKDIRIYDSSVRSDNEALDTILTEKRLVCEAEDINLSCIADGQALSFMDPADLYSLFGNALDNAIEAVRGVSNPERRAIRVIVRRLGDMASIHIENYFEGKVRFSDGLPATSKDDAANHGYGTRSMRKTVENYDGTITMGARGQLFQVNIMIPVEVEESEA